MLQVHKQLESSILQDIVRRILKTDLATDTASWQMEKLQQSGTVYAEAANKISKATGKMEKEIKKLFADAETEVFNYDDELLIDAGHDPKAIKNISPAMRQSIDAALRKTSTEAVNLTKTVALTTQSLYIQACDLAHMQVVSGAFSYQTAIANGIKTAARQGLTVRYPSGNKAHLDVAVRRSVLTGVNQTYGKLQETRADELGLDLMEITAHAGARPEHATWQGRIVSRSGARGYLSLSDIGYGTVTGFQGANCRHNWFMFFPGASQRTYTNSELKEIDGRKVEYNKKTYTEYEAKQIQRKMEREIRAVKRELVALDTAMQIDREAFQMEFNLAAIRLKDQEARLRNFAKQTGFRVYGSRVQVYATNTSSGLRNFGRSTAQRAVWANKQPLTSLSYRDKLS